MDTLSPGTRALLWVCVPLLAALPAPAKEKPAKVTSYQVDPRIFTLTGKWASQRLMVTGRTADGRFVDLTSQARFKPANPKIAAVSKAGVVTPVGEGLSTILIEVRGVKGRTPVEVTVRGQRDDSASFVNHVRPMLAKLGCNGIACHGGQRGNGGLRLSMFGGDPESDFDVLTRSNGGRRIDRVEPEKSLLLVKASGGLGHPASLKAGTPEREMLVSWLRRGAPWRLDKEPEVISVTVTPDQRVLRLGEAVQVLASAVYSDGRRADVTAEAAFRTSDAKIATVAAGGRISAAAPGEAIIVSSYLRRAAVIRITIPQSLAAPFPGPAANNRIDELVYAKLRLLGIPPSGDCTDEEFLRRAYLDVSGVLPTVQQARAYLAETAPNRRARLIDRLLAGDEFTDFWTLKWGDLLRIKSEYPVRVWPKAVAVYHQWVRHAVAANMPYDQFARELLTSSGSNFRSAPVNFFRAVPSKDARTFGETTAQVFMGARLGCARCHAHPVENWTLQDDLGMGAFFSKVNFKSTMEWKEEIVYPDPKAFLRNPKTKDVIQPRFLGGDAVPVDREEDPRPRFAAWLTSPQNPWFAPAIANRVWYWLLDRGIVNEPDDMRPTNPPENPELLAYLAAELTGHGYDLRHLFRLILNSRTYQRSAVPVPGNERDAAHFSHYPVKRLTAEQLLDAITQVTEVPEKFRSIIPEPFSNWPAGMRAEQLSDGNAECPFLDMFGRSGRDTPYEGERNSELSLRQVLYFINSEQLENKVAGSPRLKRLLDAQKPDAELVEELYLMTLSRFPSAAEKQKLLDYLSKKKSARGQAVQDVFWAVLNTREFIFNH